MYFVVYKKGDKLIWTSNGGSRITNEISKKGIPKTNINNIYPSSTLGFGRSPHKETCDIFSKYFV